MVFESEPLITTPPLEKKHFQKMTSVILSKPMTLRMSVCYVNPVMSNCDKLH